MSLKSTKGYVDADYLREAANLLAGTKNRMAKLLQLGDAQAVLDVGCGPGTDTIGLAAMVGPTGRVIGIDHDGDMVRLANERAVEAGVADRVEHVQGDAGRMPFRDEVFDACRCERVFQHLARPKQVLAEMVRVVRPGGRIVILDADWGTSSIDSPDHVDVERRFVRHMAEHGLNNGFSGRQLRRLFVEHAITVTTLEPVTFVFTDYLFHRRLILMDRVLAAAAAAGVMTESEAANWQAALARAHEAGSYFASLSGVLIAGVR